MSGDQVRFMISLYVKSILFFTQKIPLNALSFIFWACPCPHLATLVWARSACYGLTVLRPTRPPPGQE
ncbi:MAG: hypothetical protein NZ455_00305 [Bacteroidia bacterium]|nr:hypothetical protein [Bacteroidia bacterium]